MPNQPKTPNRSVGVPDELCSEARTLADESGETMTTVVNRLLTGYVAAAKPKRNCRRVSAGVRAGPPPAGMIGPWTNVDRLPSAT